MLSGVVYYQRIEQETFCYGNLGGGVLVSPKHLQIIILEHCYDNPGAEDTGINKTTERIK